MNCLIACDSSGLCQPAFPQPLNPHFLETAFEPPFPEHPAVLHRGNRLKKGTSVTAKPVFGTQGHLDGPSGAKGCLSRTNVDPLVITIKIWGSLLPPSTRNTEKGLTPILLMEVGNSEFEKKKITI